MTISPDLASAVAPATAAVPYELAWYAADLKSGAIIEELPSITPTQALSRRLGTSTTCSADLALAGAPAGWEAATAPGRTMFVAVDIATDTPIWAGLVITRTGGAASTVQHQLVTPEAYFDRRYTGDITQVQQDQAAVVSAVLAPALVDGPCFTVDALSTGVLMDYSVADSDDKTVLSSLTEIMGIEGGPEWTVDVVWADAAHTAFALPIRVRASIGSQASEPEGTFDVPGCVADYTLTESYETGKGATVVQARGEGEGDSRLTSTVYTATDLIAGGWPRWIYRWTPASGITDPVQLDAHAAAALALMQTGSTVWTIQATASRAPRLGTAWNLGDTVRLAVEHSQRHPAGADVVARAWSWTLDTAADTVTPILVEDDS